MMAKAEFERNQLVDEEDAAVNPSLVTNQNQLMSSEVGGNEDLEDGYNLKRQVAPKINKDFGNRDKIKNHFFAEEMLELKL